MKPLPPLPFLLALLSVRKIEKEREDKEVKHKWMGREKREDKERVSAVFSSLESVCFILFFCSFLGLFLYLLRSCKRESRGAEETFVLAVWQQIKWGRGDGNGGENLNADDDDGSATLAEAAELRLLTLLCWLLCAAGRIDGVVELLPRRKLFFIKYINI